MKRDSILLKALLLSTSQANIFKYSKDKKKRGRAVGGWIGNVILYALLIIFCIAMCAGYGWIGMTDSIPVMCALLISMLAFIFTIFKTNGYLFHFREYDMLMSLPFHSRTVAACKFLYMYVNSLPWYLSISLAMMIGYGYYARPHFLVYPLWVLLSIFLPVIPMLIAAFFGFLIARISVGFKKTQIVQTVLVVIFIIFCFSLRFIIENLMRNGQIESVLEMTSDITGKAAGFYLPVRWFSDAITQHNALDMLLLIGISILVFAIVFCIVGNSYRKINSALQSHAAAKKYRMGAQKKRSVLQSIAFKEYRRMTGSSVYLTNGAIGVILSLILGVVMLFIGFDRIIGVLTHNAPFDYTIIHPAIPFIAYFFIGMVATTAFTPSLEGRNYWIVQSMPIEKKTLYQGKMLFNMYLTVPAMMISTLCMCISARVPVLDTILYLILGVALCAFSTTWGCVCGIRHMRLDWENEVEVIKQGSAVTIYVLPNLFAAMALGVGVVFLGMQMDHRLVALILILVAVVLAVLCYMRVMKLARAASGV